MLRFDSSEDQVMVLEMSKGQWLSLSEKDNEGQCVRPLPQKFPCALYEAIYSCVSIGKEQLILYQGKDSNSFIHRTLTKSSNKSMTND